MLVSLWKALWTNQVVSALIDNQQQPTNCSKHYDVITSATTEKLINQYLSNANTNSKNRLWSVHYC